MVVLDVGEHLSAPGARPADSAMPMEDYISGERTSLVRRPASRTHQDRVLGEGGCSERGLFGASGLRCDVVRCDVVRCD